VTNRSANLTIQQSKYALRARQHILLDVQGAVLALIFRQ
jgi:hypothetical protein